MCHQLFVRCKNVACATPVPLRKYHGLVRFVPGAVVRCPLQCAYVRRIEPQDWSVAAAQPATICEQCTEAGHTENRLASESIATAAAAVGQAPTPSQSAPEIVTENTGHPVFSQAPILLQPAASATGPTVPPRWEHPLYPPVGFRPLDTGGALTEVRPLDTGVAVPETASAPVDKGKGRASDTDSMLPRPPSNPQRTNVRSI